MYDITNCDVHKKNCLHAHGSSFLLDRETKEKIMMRMMRKSKL